MTAYQKETFIKVATSPVIGIEPEASLVDPGRLSDVSMLSTRLGIPVIIGADKYDVFLWRSPLKNPPDEEFPPQMRVFIGTTATAEERSLAMKMINRYGPIISLQRAKYDETKINQIKEREEKIVLFEVPPHQGRGFTDKGIFVFETKHGTVIKFSTSTKGNGTTGYWIENRKREMLNALEKNDEKYPLHPDPLHARVNSGQNTTGQAKGDDVTWVGSASDAVTKREVEGFKFYEESGIFHPVCFSVKRFDELPLSTGEFIRSEQFTRIFSQDAQLVYLAKAWALETRIWQSHFSNKKLSAAHLYSAKYEGEFQFENSLRELKDSVNLRKETLRKESFWVLKILQITDKKSWKSIFGFAGEALSKVGNILSTLNVDNVIPTIISINMMENAARAGANRLFGKPVAWHLGNVGRLGEVSGGERIYGKAKEGPPEAMEIHSLFSYVFDAYNAIAIEWASAGMPYISIDNFFQSVKNRILQLNNNHWIFSCQNIDQFVSLCQSNYPSYQVLYRNEDAYPLVAVPDFTDPEVQLEGGKWKDWGKLKNNMEKFIGGIMTEYKK